MTGPEFTEWLRRRDMNDSDAEEAFKITRKTIRSYRKKGTPYVLDLACRYLELDGK